LFALPGRRFAGANDSDDSALIVYTNVKKHGGPQGIANIAMIASIARIGKTNSPLICADGR
jgi:hypothetical protein